MSAGVILSFKIHETGLTLFLPLHSIGYINANALLTIFWKFLGDLGSHGRLWLQVLWTVFILDCLILSLLFSLFHPGQPSHGIQNLFSFGVQERSPNSMCLAEFKEFCEEWRDLLLSNTATIKLNIRFGVLRFSCPFPTLHRAQLWHIRLGFLPSFIFTFVLT